MENKVNETSAQEKKIDIKELMFKKVSTLIGGIVIGGAAILFLLVILLIYLCN